MRNNVSPLDAKKSIHPGGVVTKTVRKLPARWQAPVPCPKETDVWDEVWDNIQIPLYPIRRAVRLEMTGLMPPASNFIGEIHEE